MISFSPLHTSAGGDYCTYCIEKETKVQTASNFCLRAEVEIWVFFDSEPCASCVVPETKDPHLTLFYTAIIGYCRVIDKEQRFLTVLETKNPKSRGWPQARAFLLHNALQKADRPESRRGESGPSSLL